VDANSPVVVVDIESDTPHKVTAKLDLWRTKERVLPKREYHCVDGMSAADAPRVYPDTVVDTSKMLKLKNQMVWYHRNKTSVYPETLKLQSLSEFKGDDPLLNRTFGCAVGGNGLVGNGPSCLVSEHPAKRSIITIHSLTARTDTHDEWLSLLSKNVAKNQVGISTLAKRLDAHQAWWNSFWERSWVRVSGGDPKETGKISLGWHAHRYLVACTARGAYPVKFNGSIFNVPGFGRNGEKVDWVTPDYRAWGAPFWFQNQRHIYWPMLQAGDYDQMLPFFKMYLDALPLARERSKKYYGHNGVLFPETMMFWGTYLNSNYGWDRKAKPAGLTDNGYIRRYWQGGLELTAMMLDYYHHTQDEVFVKETLLPIVSEVITFYDEHYKRDKEGKIRFYPAQVLESIWDAENPMPEIAGLGYVLPQLLALPKTLINVGLTEKWQRVLNELPPLPKGEAAEKECLLGAQVVRGRRHNQENARLYAVWPYRLFGSGLPEYELALHTWKTRPIKFKVNSCWHNDMLLAAHVGLANEARHALANRFNLCGPFKFPAMYIKGDWPPDHDNGGVCQNTVQSMLMQCIGKRILLLPAWPKEWNADFKLHAPMQTTVEGRVENGELVDLKVTPELRRKDIEILGGFSK